MVIALFIGYHKPISVNDFLVQFTNELTIYYDMELLSTFLWSYIQQD